MIPKNKSIQMSINYLMFRIINTITIIALHYQQSTSIKNVNLKFGLQMNTTLFPVTNREALYHRSCIPDLSPSPYVLQPLAPPLGPSTRCRRLVLLTTVFTTRVRIKMGDVGRFWGRRISMGDVGRFWGRR